MTGRLPLSALPDRLVFGPDTGRGVVESVAAHTDAVLAELRAAAAYVATLAYWGDERTDRWWFEDLERLIS
jgi:hypothetical protein